jgi:hypothetical protein
LSARRYEIVKRHSGRAARGQLDALLVKFDAVDNVLRSRRYDSTGSAYDVAFRMMWVSDGGVHMRLRPWAGVNFDGLTLIYSAAAALSCASARSRVRAFPTTGSWASR